MSVGAATMEFSSRTKEVALADLTRKRDQLPFGHGNRPVRDRMIADLHAELILERDRANGLRSVAIVEN